MGINFYNIGQHLVVIFVSFPLFYSTVLELIGVDVDVD